MRRHANKDEKKKEKKYDKMRKEQKYEGKWQESFEYLKRFFEE